MKRRRGLQTYRLKSTPRPRFNIDDIDREQCPP